jgi:hypothetical protein
MIYPVNHLLNGVSPPQTIEEVYLWINADLEWRRFLDKAFPIKELPVFRWREDRMLQLQAKELLKSFRLKDFRN